MVGNLPWNGRVHGALVAVLVADGSHGAEYRQGDVEDEAEPALEESAPALFLLGHQLLRVKSSFKAQSRQGCQTMRASLAIRAQEICT